MQARDPQSGTGLVVHDGILEPPKAEPEPAAPPPPNPADEFPRVETAPETVRQRILQRFAYEAATGPCEPATVAAGKVVLDYLETLAPVKKPATAREMLEAVRKALPDLVRRAEAEAGAPVPAEATGTDSGEW